jgi:hypothetical protein
VKQEIAQETVKSAPAVAATVWAWTPGLNLTDLVALATLAYIALQAGLSDLDVVARPEPLQFR